MVKLISFPLKKKKGDTSTNLNSTIIVGHKNGPKAKIYCQEKEFTTLKPIKYCPSTIQVLWIKILSVTVELNLFYSLLKAYITDKKTQLGFQNLFM